MFQVETYLCFGDSRLNFVYGACLSNGCPRATLSGGSGKADLIVQMYFALGDYELKMQLLLCPIASEIRENVLISLISF